MIGSEWSADQFRDCLVNRVPATRFSAHSWKFRSFLSSSKWSADQCLSDSLSKKLRATRFPAGTSIGHYQNERSTQRHLGSFAETRQAKIPSKNAAPQQLWLFVQPGTQQLYCRGIFAGSLACLLDWFLSLQRIPSAIAVVIRSQLPARFGNGQLDFVFVIVCVVCNRQERLVEPDVEIWKILCTGNTPPSR